ncbi:hypothetical protein [Cytobacillus sp. BC1816]
MMKGIRKRIKFVRGESFMKTKRKKNGGTSAARLAFIEMSAVFR